MKLFDADHNIKISLVWEAMVNNRSDRVEKRILEEEEIA